MSLATKLALVAVIWDIVTGLFCEGRWKGEVYEVEYCHDGRILSRYKNQFWATLQVSIRTQLHVTVCQQQYKYPSALSFM